MEKAEGWRKILKERDEAAFDLEAPVLQVVQFSLRISATVEKKTHNNDKPSMLS